MNKGLRQEIKEEAESNCSLCNGYAATGDPHHITKVSEEPLLRNCKKNIMWVCRPCHNKTENVPGFNKKLKKQLLEHYMTLISKNEYYYPTEIAIIVQMPYEDLEKAIFKHRLKTEFVNHQFMAKGEDILRFLMGGQLPKEEQ